MSREITLVDNEIDNFPLYISFKIFFSLKNSVKVECVSSRARWTYTHTHTLVTVVIYEGLYFDLAQGQMNGAPNETLVTVT